MQIMYYYICDPLLTCTCVRYVHTDPVTAWWVCLKLSTVYAKYRCRYIYMDELPNIAPWDCLVMGLPWLMVHISQHKGNLPSVPYVHCAAHSLKSDHRQCCEIDYQSLAAAPLISGKNAPLFSCQLGNLSKAKKPVSLCSSAALFSPLLL